MKKFLAIVACAALLTGCDFVGGSDVDPVMFSSLTLNAAPIQAGDDVDLYVEIQDASGRAVAQSEVDTEFAGTFPYTVPGLSGELGGSARSYFVVVADQGADHPVLAISDGFSADDLRATSGDTFVVSNEAGTIQAEIAISR